jgi:hypothetical protein
MNRNEKNKKEKDQVTRMVKDERVGRQRGEKEKN